jgi:hypothetical protein
LTPSGVARHNGPVLSFWLIRPVRLLREGEQTMAQGEPPAVSAPDRAAGRRKGWWTALWVLPALVVLLVVIGAELRVLWREWGWLEAERSWVRQTAVIGYPNISPRVSYAQPPDNWFRQDGDSTYLWGGWDPRLGHQWFRITRGDLEATSISLPMGRDIHQAIDHPLIEAEGGPIWARIPAEARVVGLNLAGVATVYPLLVLDRVQVINDLIGQQPVLVTYNPFVSPDACVKVYDAALDGQRVTMGTSGYYQAGFPLFYDRGSESLWKDQQGALRAVAGPRKGRVLRQLAQPAPVAWGDWRWRNPGSRLLVGADRSGSGESAPPSSLEDQ